MGVASATQYAFLPVLSYHQVAALSIGEVYRYRQHAEAAVPVSAVQMADQEGGERKKACGQFFCNFFKNLKIKKFTGDNILYWYIPAAGSISYIAFSAHIFNPNILPRLFPTCSHAVANCLLFNSHLGTGLYLYKRRHLSPADLYYKVTYCVYGALMFNFGSVLLWAITKVVLPDNPYSKAVFGLSTSLCLLLIGKEYFEFVDSNFSIAEH